MKPIFITLCLLLAALPPCKAFASTAPTADDGEFTLDMIQNWTGTGSNRAALAIQWNDPEGRIPNALVFGYRWDGTATNMDMVEAIVKNNPRLYALWSPGWTSGYMISGFGWDDDNDGAIGLYDSSASCEYDDPDGWYENPDQFAWTFSNWEALDFDGDVFQASSNWNYFSKTSSTATFKKGSMGFSEQTLADDTWIGFIYAGDNDYTTKKWGLLEAAPETIVEEVKTDFEIDGICYHLTNQLRNEVQVTAPFEGATVTQYQGNIVVPQSFVDEDNTYIVTAVAADAFRSSAVSTITLPQSVKAVGDYAFASSTITAVNLNKVTTLGKGIFAGCGSITEYCLPTQITQIPEKTFSGTGITALSIPETVTAVGEEAFGDCASLTSVEILKTLTTVSPKAFSGSNAISVVKVETMTPLAITDDVFSTECYSNATLQLPIGASEAYRQATGWSNFQTMQEYAINVAVGDVFTFPPYTYQVTAVGDGNNMVMLTKSVATGDAVVPASVSYQDINFAVTEIGASAFAKSSALTSVTFPETITTLPDRVFEKCTALTTFTLPSQITAIGTYTFADCTGLTEVDLGQTITEIPERTFSGCSNLLSVTIPEGLTAFGASAFYNCTKLHPIEIPAGVNALADYMFYGCKAMDIIEVPATVSSLGRYTFANCYALTSVSLPEGITQLPLGVFYNCIALKHIDLPTSITNLGDYCFNSSAIESLYIHDGVERIGSNAFYSCSGLTSIEIPATVTYIGTEAFHYTNQDLVLYMVNPDAIANTFTYKNIVCYPSKYPTIYVPAGKAAEYQVKDGWKYAKFAEAPAEGQSFESEWLEIADSSVDFAITTEPIFGDSYPQRYLDAHKPLLAQSAQVLLQLRHAGTEEWTDYAATTTDNSRYNATATDLQQICEYEYRWAVTYGDNETFVSATENFPIIVTGVETVTTHDDNASALIYNLQGVCLGSDAANLAPGIYVLVNPSKASATRKIVIK